MKPWPLILLLALVVNAQDLPSPLAISREDANQALTDAGQELVTDGAKGIVGARARQLEGLSQLSQKKAKATFDLKGANQGQQAKAIKDNLGQKASWLKKFKSLTGVLDYGETIGQAGGYLAEGDARGAFGVVADTAGKKLSGLAGGAMGTFVGGPLGAVAGSAAGEGSWAINPWKKRIQSAVDESRFKSLSDELLGYRPSWRSKEASDAKKKREAERAKEPQSPEAADAEGALRKQVEGRLISQNLPAPEALVNQLVGIIQARGQDALDAALKECSAMQGSFEGTLNGKGSLQLSVEGMAVSATFSDRTEASAGGITAVATTSGAFTGTFDPVSGNLTFSGPVKTIAVAKGIKPTPDIVSVRFTGHFTGQGFKGNAIANDRSLPWSVSR
ncbi:MAG: hypothetical protein H6Q00_1722 [Holophagaceae bacterium]|nr:hypothetical protein [Holophagaceae bacterium]